MTEPLLQRWGLARGAATMIPFLQLTAFANPTTSESESSGPTFYY
jgi:hypothetical protein